MLFKQLTAFTIEMPLYPNGLRERMKPQEWREHLVESLYRYRFRDILKNQTSCAGWEVPHAHINEEYLVSAPNDPVYLLCYRQDERKISRKAIDEQLIVKCKQIELSECRKVSKLERSSFYDDIVAAKSPHVLPTPVRTLVVIDLNNSTILIGTSSESKALEIKRAIYDQLLPKFLVDDLEVKPKLIMPVHCKSDARDLMTNWILDDNELPPDNISLGESVKLGIKGGKKIQVTGHSMYSPVVVDALNSGYRPELMSVSIMNGDHVMADIVLDRYGTFNKIKVSGDFDLAGSGDVDNEYDLLLSNLTNTALTYEYVFAVVSKAFGNEPKIDLSDWAKNWIVVNKEELV